MIREQLALRRVKRKVGGAKSGYQVPDGNGKEVRSKDPSPALHAGVAYNRQDQERRGKR